MKTKQPAKERKQPVRKQQHRIQLSGGDVHTFEIESVSTGRFRNGERRIFIGGKIIK